MLSDDNIEELWVSINKGKFMFAGFNTFARAIEAAVLPEGWVAVPKEPTLAMLDCLRSDITSNLEKRYQAMLAAAPKPARYETWTDARCAIGTCEGGMNHDPKCEKAEKQEPVAWCVAYDDPRMGRIHSNPSMHKPELEALIGRAGNQLVLVPLYTRPQPEPVKDEPVYQVWRSPDSCGEFYSWDDCDKSEYNTYATPDRRILYTRPQPEPVKDEPVTTWSGPGWNETKQLLAELDHLPVGTDLYTRPQPDLTAEVERLEWENKGIAEWRDIAISRQQRIAELEAAAREARDALQYKLHVVGAIAKLGTVLGNANVCGLPHGKEDK